MTSKRDAILLGVREAAETHIGFRVRECIEERGGPVDVFGLIQELGVPLLFRPLDGLLGACIRSPDGDAGILITSQRGLHLQRFTAAHELGHYVLQHEGSLDREIRFPGQTANRDFQEIAADAFAAELLMPKWLIREQSRIHGWTLAKLRNPMTVYQLSLRLAVSYEAMCLGLQEQNILTRGIVNTLQTATPKSIKQRILGATALDNWRPHVWQLDEHDDGGAIEAGPDDIFVTALTEHSGSGYVWDTAELNKSGFAIIDDIAEQDDPGTVGGSARRRIVLKGPPPGSHRLAIPERRPWVAHGPPAQTLTVNVSTFGAEAKGLPRRNRASAAPITLH